MPIYLKATPLGMKINYSIKQILLSNGNWYRFYEANKDKIRTAIVIGVTKLLSCKNIIRGYHQYRCENPSCPHIKRIPHTCKSKACSSCGKKATELWIQKQNGVLPDTQWQHITFTLPSLLWDFFWTDRELLDFIGKIAAHAVMTLAKKKGVIPAIFIAIHTFGRDLKRNIHIHLSTTLGGITFDLKQWKKLFFSQEKLMKIWRYEIIKLFRKRHKEGKLIIPSSVEKKLNHTYTFNHLLDELYKKCWIVHCTKPSKSYKNAVNYLGRYVKRPPIAQSKLRHYDGDTITFAYRDHTRKEHRDFQLSVDNFIGRFIQHIPDLGFRMIRYYGALANRVRGKILPSIYQLLGQKKISEDVKKSTGFAFLMEKDFGVNPLKCILCGKNLVLELINYGKSSIYDLLSVHRELALMKKI